MNERDKEALRNELLATGALAVGFAAAERIPLHIDAEYRRWLEDNKNAGMGWMERHAALRCDPVNVLPGVKTIISIAFPYGPAPSETVPAGISAYARGEDYHRVLRRYLEPVVRGRKGNWRICIDSAPLPERYWASKAGIGFIGDNGALIIPGVGSQVFLAEILTDVQFIPDKELRDECLHCGLCKINCPTGAMENPLIDCRRCISYLTIEHRGAWTDMAASTAMATEAGRTAIFGCDRCISCCPLNSEPISPLPEFRVSETSIRIGEGRMDEISRSEIKKSPIARAFPDGIKRNLENLTDFS